MKYVTGCGCLTLVGLVVFLMTVGLAARDGNGRATPAALTRSVAQASARPTPMLLMPSATPTAAATGTATPDPADLWLVVEAGWANSDWPKVIAALETLSATQPDALELRDKLYAGYYLYGKTLLERGQRTDAGVQFAQAATLDPGRPEAKAEILALSATPTPVPPTATPTPGPWMSAPVRAGDLVLVVGDLHFLNAIGYSRPETGKEFVVMAVTIKNIGDERESFNQLGFSLKDGKGVIRRTAFVVGIDNELHSGSLAPGGVVSGWLPFEIGRGDRTLTLIWSPCWLVCAEKEIQLQETYRR